MVATIGAPSGASLTSTVELTYHPGTLVALAASARKHGAFVMPVVYLAGTDRNVIIDGHHRLKVASDLAAEGICIAVEHKELETPDPDGMRIELNKNRRPWNDKEERRTQAQALAAAGFSTRQASDVLGVDKNTVRSDLKATDTTGENSPVGSPPAEASKPKHSAKKPPAGPDEIAEAFRLRDEEGLTSKAIAERLERNQNTIGAWFKKAAAAHQQAPPAVPLEPNPSAPLAALPTQPVKPDKPDRYKKEIERIKKLLAIKDLLAAMELDLEALCRKRKGDGPDRLASAPGWHQEVVAHIELYEPEMAAELAHGHQGKRRFLLEEMEDLERLARRVSNRVKSALIAHGYFPYQPTDKPEHARFEHLWG